MPAALAMSCGFAAPGARADVAISRASLASEARFTVTYTLSPAGGKPSVQVFTVAVSGSKGRADYAMEGLGNVRYVANDQGVFLYIPANKAAQKMTGGKGIDAALKLAFQEAVQQLKGAKKVGAATVSGIPTDLYRNPKTGTAVYLGTKPGFQLPVKMELSNAGGRRTILVTGIALGGKIPASLFALPPGTKIIDSNSQAKGAGPGIPGVK